MTPTTQLSDPTLDLRVYAVEAARALGCVTVAELAGVTEADLLAKGARTRDVTDLRRLIVAAGGQLANARPRGRPTGWKVGGGVVRVPLTAAVLARLDEVRGGRSREEKAAELMIAGLSDE